MSNDSRVAFEKLEKSVYLQNVRVMLLLKDVYTYTNICEHIYAYMYIYLYMHMYMFIYIYMYVYKYVYVCI